MRRVLAITVMCAVLSICLRAQARVGQQAPVLRLSNVLQGESNLPKHGHALLIEFWASWCQPCTASIPHLNSLAEQFGAANLDFLWLNEESLEKAGSFLQPHPMSGTVAFDSDGALWKAFDARGLPTTVLVDMNGRIAAITRAEFVKSSVLMALLEERSLPLSPLEIDIRISDHHLPSGRKANDSDAETRIIVRRADQDSVSWGNSQGEFETLGHSLKQLLAEAYRVSPYLIEMPDYLNQLYAVEGWVPDRHPETFGPLMQAALTSAASIHVSHRARVVTVLVFSGLPGNLQVSATDGGTVGKSRPGNIAWKNASAETIRTLIESAAGKPVVLDSPVSGRYDFTLNWDPAEFSSLSRALQSQGLSLKERKRQLEVLVVQSLDEVHKVP